MLVALVAFEGCKDTKKDENKTPPPAAGGESPDVNANAPGKQDQLGPDQNKPKQKSKQPSKPATTPFKPVEKSVKVKLTAGVDKDVMIKGSVFTENGKDGDFASMITKDEYKTTLFVFNDNEEAYDDFQSQLAAGVFDSGKPGCTAGKGNAVIRPEQCKTPQRAAGIDRKSVV